MMIRTTLKQYSKESLNSVIIYSYGYFRVPTAKFMQKRPVHHDERINESSQPSGTRKNQQCGTDQINGLKVWQKVDAERGEVGEAGKPSHWSDEQQLRAQQCRFSIQQVHNDERFHGQCSKETRKITDWYESKTRKEEKEAKDSDIFSQNEHYYRARCDGNNNNEIAYLIQRRRQDYEPKHISINSSMEQSYVSIQGDDLTHYEVPSVWVNPQSTQVRHNRSVLLPHNIFTNGIQFTHKKGIIFRPPFLRCIWIHRYLHWSPGHYATTNVA